MSSAAVGAGSANLGEAHRDRSSVEDMAPAEAHPSPPAGAPDGGPLTRLTEKSEGRGRECDSLGELGEFFGLPGHVRIGFGGDAEQLDRALGRFADALRRYRPS